MLYKIAEMISALFMVLGVLQVGQLSYASQKEIEMVEQRHGFFSVDGDIDGVASTEYLPDENPDLATIEFKSKAGKVLGHAQIDKVTEDITRIEFIPRKSKKMPKIRQSLEMNRGDLTLQELGEFGFFPIANGMEKWADQSIAFFLEHPVVKGLKMGQLVRHSGRRDPHGDRWEITLDPDRLNSTTAKILMAVAALRSHKELEAEFSEEKKGADVAPTRSYWTEGIALVAGVIGGSLVPAAYRSLLAGYQARSGHPTPYFPSPGVGWVRGTPSIFQGRSPQSALNREEDFRDPSHSKIFEIGSPELTPRFLESTSLESTSMAHSPLRSPFVSTSQSNYLPKKKSVSHLDLPLSTGGVNSSGQQQLSSPSSSIAYGLDTERTGLERKGEDDDDATRSPPAQQFTRPILMVSRPEFVGNDYWYEPTHFYLHPNTFTNVTDFKSKQIKAMHLGTTPSTWLNILNSNADFKIWYMNLKLELLVLAGFSSSEPSSLHLLIPRHLDVIVLKLSQLKLSKTIYPASLHQDPTLSVAVHAMNAQMINRLKTTKNLSSIYIQDDGLSEDDLFQFVRDLEDEMNDVHLGLHVSVKAFRS